MSGRLSTLKGWGIVSLMLSEAQSYMNRGQFNSAERMYMTACKLDSGNPLIYRGLAHIIYNCGDRDKASIYYSWMSDNNCPVAMVIYFEGVLLYRAGEVNKAIEVLKNAYSEDRTNAYALNNIGKAKLVSKAAEECKYIFRSALREMRKRRDRKGVMLVQTNIAQFHLKRRNFDSAYKQLHYLTEHFPPSFLLPEFSNAICTLGELSFACSKSREAKRHFRRALMVSRQCFMVQNQIRSLYYLALIYHIEGQSEIAISHFSEALGLAETVNDGFWVAEIICQMAYISLGESDFSSVEELLKRGIEYFCRHGIVIGFTRPVEREKERPDDKIATEIKGHGTESVAGHSHLLRRITAAISFRIKEMDFYTSLVNTCFSMVENNDFAEAYRLLDGFLNAKSSKDYDLVLRDYKRFRRMPFFGSGSIEKGSFLIKEALGRIGKEIDDSRRLGRPLNYSSINAKSLFLAFFITQYLYKYDSRFMLATNLGQEYSQQIEEDQNQLERLAVTGAFLHGAVVIEREPVINFSANA
jgi:tetratricopeptide (TPR) repeat protein